MQRIERGAGLFPFLAVLDGIFDISYDVLLVDLPYDKEIVEEILELIVDTTKSGGLQDEYFAGRGFGIPQGA